MMGYAKQGQNTRGSSNSNTDRSNFHFVKVENCLSGIHTRNFARAFIVEDVETETRVVFVSCDTAMMGQLVKVEHLSLLIKM